MTPFSRTIVNGVMGLATDSHREITQSLGKSDANKPIKQPPKEWAVPYRDGDRFGTIVELAKLPPGVKFLLCFTMLED